MKKFGAKKITALAAAMAVVTVGGVYANWIYANSSTYGANSDALTFRALDSNVTGDYGEINATRHAGYSGNLYLLDQYSDINNNIYDASINPDGTHDTYGAYKYGTTYNNGTNAPAAIDNHTVTLCVEETSYYLFTFTATSAADADVYNYGVNTTVTLSLNTACGYYYTADGETYAYQEGTNTNYYPMFSLATTTLTILPSNVSPTGDYQYNWASTGTAGEFTCTLDADDLLSLINLDYMVVSTSTIYTNFSAAALGTNITATISAS